MTMHFTSRARFLFLLLYRWARKYVYHNLSRGSREFPSEARGRKKGAINVNLPLCRDVARCRIVCWCARQSQRPSRWPFSPTSSRRRRRRQRRRRCRCRRRRDLEDPPIIRSRHERWRISQMDTARASRRGASTSSRIFDKRASARVASSHAAFNTTMHAYVYGIDASCRGDRVHRRPTATNDVAWRFDERYPTATR